MATGKSLKSQILLLAGRAGKCLNNGILVAFFFMIFPAVAFGLEKGHFKIPLHKAAYSEPGRAVPHGWKLKEWKGRADFDLVETEFGNAFHLKSDSTSVALYRDISLASDAQYPMINWSWKALKLPKGADCRKRSADDQAAQVYVIFDKWPGKWNSRVIGYIWDTSAPKGSKIQSPKSFNTRYIVLRSGPEGTGGWLQEKRNIREDYRELFKEEPPPVSGISIMIDSDDTKSHAESYVGNIYLSRD